MEIIKFDFTETGREAKIIKQIISKILYDDQTVLTL